MKTILLPLLLQLSLAYGHILPQLQEDPTSGCKDDSSSCPPSQPHCCPDGIWCAPTAADCPTIEDNNDNNTCSNGSWSCCPDGNWCFCCPDNNWCHPTTANCSSAQKSKVSEPQLISECPEGGFLCTDGIHSTCCESGSFCCSSSLFCASSPEDCPDPESESGPYKYHHCCYSSRPCMTDSECPGSISCCYWEPEE